MSRLPRLLDRSLDQSCGNTRQRLTVARSPTERVDGDTGMIADLRAVDRVETEARHRHRDRVVIELRDQFARQPREQLVERLIETTGAHQFTEPAPDPGRG